MTVLEIVLALFLPPVAVLIDKGPNGQFWLSVVLLFLGFVPSVVYAFYVLTADRRLPTRV